MKTAVIDASVAAKWFFSEEHADAALELLASPTELLAPELIWAELGNVVWKRVRRKEITRDEGSQILGDFVRMPLKTTPAVTLLIEAYELAVEVDHSLYDCLYLALAIRHRCKLVTADDKLARSIIRTSLSEFVCPLDKVL